MTEADTGTEGQRPYKLPEKAASATIHFLYGLPERGNHASVKDYLLEKKYALIADLVQEGFTQEQIEEAVNSDTVKVAPVFQTRISDLFWVEEHEGELDKLAAQMERECGGDGTDENVPVMGDVVSVGGTLGSQQTAMVALVYAAHKGIIVETTNDRGMGVGPLFISKKSPMASIFVSAQPSS